MYIHNTYSLNAINHPQSFSLWFGWVFCYIIRYFCSTPYPGYRRWGLFSGVVFYFIKVAINFRCSPKHKYGQANKMHICKCIIGKIKRSICLENQTIDIKTVVEKTWPSSSSSFPLCCLLPTRCWTPKAHQSSAAAVVAAAGGAGSTANIIRGKFEVFLICQQFVAIIIIIIKIVAKIKVVLAGKFIPGSLWPPAWTTALPLRHQEDAKE